MLIRSLHDCEEFQAGDGSILRQLLHPENTDVSSRYSLCHATVKPGQRTRLHRLHTTEVYYILEGEGLMTIDDETRRVGSGQTVYIPPGARQSLYNDGRGDLRFLCIVDPAWREQDEELL